MMIATLLLTADEIDALAVAVARSVDPGSAPKDASEAAAVIWSHHSTAGQPLCSLATLLAETAGGVRLADELGSSS